MKDGEKNSLRQKGKKDRKRMQTPNAIKYGTILEVPFRCTVHGVCKCFLKEWQAFTDDS